MNTTRARFRPPLWSTVLLLILCALFVSAGFWQLDRAEQKRALFRAFDQADNGPPLETLVDDHQAEEYKYRQFRVTGQYDSDHQILLDSLTYKGQDGFQVLTPLIHGETALLVNRGWHPQSADRSLLPDISVNQQPRQISGRLSLLPQSGFKLAAIPADENSSWPRRLLFPTAAEIEQQLGYAVYNYQLLLTDSSPDFIRDWRPILPGPEKNVGYAIQWFSFAIAITIIYLIMNFRRSGKGAS